MNTTVKRKFNALLQGIGNRPVSVSDQQQAGSLQPSETSSSLQGLLAPTSPNSILSSSPASIATTMGNDSEFLAKKRRVLGPTTPSKYGALRSDSPGQSPLRAVGGTTTISNITLRKWTPAGSPAPSVAGSKSEGPPKYCPGDREQLVRRLATFQELTDWTPKPDRVNEVEWAKRGWVCNGKERVKCALCGRELVVKINRKEVDGKEIAVLIASEIAQSVVDRYAELIVDAHGEDCLWRKKGCDDSLLRLPLPNPKLALQHLRERYDELCERKDFLPYEFNLRLPPSLNLDTILSYLPPNFFTVPAPKNPLPSPNRSALALALLGWQSLTNPRLGSVPNSASCHTCLRRLGLWMFKSKEVDPETNTILVPAPMDHLDPLREHRFFCPWKSGVAQRNSAAKSGAEDKAGWEILVEVLRNEAFVRQRTSVAHSRSKSSVPPGGLSGAKEQTPDRPTTSVGYRQLAGDEEGEEDTKKKDQAVMSRLRRVKSLFNTKGNKLKRLGSSRPGTAHGE